ncbi:MAG: hypothetical protein ACRDDY_13360 [Clostridium sp.]|uniref:hypothetical protein n=1 Tax=Clostridium sp. TaxID=1506 RepID=UPI003EE514B1
MLKNKNKIRRYFSYSKQTGDFEGFYSSDINSVIPENTVEITNELFITLREGVYKLNLEKLNSIKGVLDIKDISSFFIQLSNFIKEEPVDTMKSIKTQIGALGDGMQESVMEQYELKMQVNALSKAVFELTIKGGK